MEASSSQFPSSRTRTKTKLSTVNRDADGDKDGDDNRRTVVVTRSLDERHLKAIERRRSKRERDQSGGSPRKIAKISGDEDGEGADSITDKAIAEKAYLKAEEVRRKARERQRRRREHERSLRDLSSADVSRVGVGGLLVSPQNREIPGHPFTSLDGTRPTPSTSNDLMTPEERAKKEKIRQNARERQRKHRALVKAKRIIRLDLPMTDNVEPSDMQGDSISHPCSLHPDLDISSQTQPFPFPAPQPFTTLGHAFAQILFLSISCTPTLRQDLLEALRMSDEDLVSLTPGIASVWDQWNYERSIRRTEDTSPSEDQDHNNAASTSTSTSYIPPSPDMDVNTDQDQLTDAGQSPEMSSLSSNTDFPETPLVSIIYHLRNRLGQLFVRENRNRH